MLLRFRKRNMILDEVPDTPVEDTIYPEVMSAEYFQSIQDNNLFNHLGYDDKPKESFGVVTIEFERDATNLEGPLRDPLLGDPEFVDEDRGRVWGGTRSILVNLDGTLAETDGTSITESDTGENNDKFGGADSFTTTESYTVQLTVDQFIGVDFNAENQGQSIASDDLDRIQIQPLINPDNEAVSYDTGAEGSALRYRQADNRHNTQIAPGGFRDRETRSTFINMSVFEKTETAFKIFVSRTNVFAEVLDGTTLSSAEIVPIHDYQRTGTRAGANSGNVSREHVLYVPNLDPENSGSAVTPVLFNRANLDSYPRNFLRIAWYAKGT